MGKYKPLIKNNTYIICQKIKDERNTNPNIIFYDEVKKQIGNNLINNKTNNENEYDCGLYETQIPGNSEKGLEMRVIFNSPGVYEISGLAMTLFF